MLFQNALLHNVLDTAEGDISTVIAPDAMETFKAYSQRHKVSEEIADRGLWLSRLPNEVRLKLNYLGQFQALRTSGVELRFNQSPDEEVVIRVNNPLAPALVEVWQGCFMQPSRYPLPVGDSEISVKPEGCLGLLAKVTAERNLPFDSRLMRVVLPWNQPIRLLGIKGNIEPPRDEQVKAPRYLAYGSSITHGASTTRPTGSWASRTAQLLGADLINLGLAGSCHLEKEMADHIAERSDWDFCTLEMGINIGGIGNEEFTRRVRNLIRTVAHAHPDKWIFCIDVFTCQSDLNGECRFSDFRRIVAEEVASLKMPKLVHLSGLDILTDPCGLSIDCLHPAPGGMEDMARNLAALIRKHRG